LTGELQTGAGLIVVLGASCKGGRGGGGVLVVAPPHLPWANAYLRFGYLTKGVDLMQASWRCCIAQNFVDRPVSQAPRARS
jgi:hypothetical protein